MYCPTCACGFAGWTGKCPVDGTLLVPHPTTLKTAIRPAVSYETVVDLIRKNDGVREIELQTSEVGRTKRFGFPGRGYGFAWARRMQGEIDGIAVELQIDEVGTRKEFGFPYQGYGFAWEQRMRGSIGGHEIILTATDVAHEKKFYFPYRGSGYSWARTLAGDCGESIRAEMQTTDVSRDKGWFLFYFMFGYAWINRATLRLSLGG